MADADRRMRLTVLANKTIPPNAMRMMKRAVGWGKGNALHRHLSLDGNVGGPGPGVIA